MKFMYVLYVYLASPYEKITLQQRKFNLFIENYRVIC